MKILEHLSRQELEAAARKLNIELAMVMAFAEVESPRGPFDQDGHPSILFERHVFHRNSRGRWSKRYPDLSAPNPYPLGGYGTFEAQKEKLKRARQLDEGAAIKACSWGMFQILGENHKLVGFESPQSMEIAMRSVPSQLDAFVKFVAAKPGLAHFLRVHDYRKAASIYNGRDYARDGYHTKLEAAYLDAKSYLRTSPS